MLKTVTFLWKREGLSTTEFRDYYETVHARIGERVLSGWALHYVRRFLNPEFGQADPEMPDVVMEIWYADRATFEACMAALGQGAVAAEIAADEAKLFAPGKMRTFTVEEHVSAL